MPPEGLNEVDARDQLARVLASAGFARNERMSRFLTFVVEESLAGRGDNLKESVIALEVFARRPDYDPRIDSIVRTEAARLRTRLAEYYAGAGKLDDVLITVPKGGYHPVFTTREHAEEPAPNRRLWQRLWVALACGAAAAVGLSAWLAVGSARPIRIAVLPLENLSTEPSSAYFADGLTDEIIRNLSVIDGLAVRSRTSSFAFKARPRDLRAAGKQLEADYLLDGSILRDGDRLRIDAQLVRVRDDVPVWSRRFDGKMNDVFSIQDEIAIGIVNDLRLQLGRGRRRYETSVDAFNVYLRARVLSTPGLDTYGERESVMTPLESFRHSIEAFQEAVRIDGSFAPAYAGLAYVYAIRSVQFPEPHPPEELPAMRAAGEQAVHLDPLLPEAHHALAMIYARDGKWVEAEQSFLRALELDPNRSSIYVDYAYWYLTVLRRHADALRELHKAVATDPLSGDVRLTLALVLVSSGRLDEADRVCRTLPTSGVCLARVRSGQGRFHEVVQLLEHHPDVLANPETRGFLGYAFARDGRRDDAEKIARAAVYPNEQALTYAGLGDKDRTFDALDRMTSVGPQRVALYLDYPEFAFIRDDPRVRILRHKVGLPESPAATGGE